MSFEPVGIDTRLLVTSNSLFRFGGIVVQLVAASLEQWSVGKMDNALNPWCLICFLHCVID